jgi:hypothetical protein
MAQINAAYWPGPRLELRRFPAEISAFSPDGRTTARDNGGFR